MPSEEEKNSYDELMSPDALAASLTRRNDPTLLGVVHPQAQVPTSAAAWRSARKQGFLVTLPSGQTVKIRRTLDLFERLRDGRIPNPLAGIVVEMIENKREQVDMSKLDGTSLGQMLALIDDTITKMMIEPQVVLEPVDAPLGWEAPEGFISTSDIEIDDKMFLFNVAQGGTADLATFRAQAAAFMGSVPDGDGVHDAAVGSDGGGG
jgi:hypothetical protein